METKSNNTKQTAWVALGSLFAFSFSIVSSMILSRYFDKVDYGTYKQVLYVYSTLLLVFTLGLPKTYAYFLPRNADNFAKSLVRKISVIFLVLGGFFSIMLFSFSNQIAEVLKNPDLGLALRIFSPVPLILLPTMGIEGIFATYHKTKFIAFYNITSKSFILLCVVLPVVLWGGSFIEAIIGFTVASFISLLFAFYLQSKCLKGKGNDRTEVTFKDLIRFSIPLFTASIWGMLFASSTKFFISRYFGTEVFADFSNGALELPFVGMIVSACSTVLLPLFSKKNSEGGDSQLEILPIWKRVFEKTIKITYPLILFFFFFAYDVMIILYGDGYYNSGLYFRIMVILSFFRVISYAPILIAINSTKFFSNVHMVGAIVLIVLQYISTLLIESPYLITSIYVICNIGMIVAMILYISKYFKITIFSIIPFKSLTLILSISTATLFLVEYIANIICGLQVHLWRLCVCFGLYVIIYFAISIIFRIDYSYIINPLRKNIR